MTEVNKPTWFLGGTAVVALFSASLLFAIGWTPLLPMPFHQVVLAWTIGYPSMVVLPLIYFVTLAALWNAKWRGGIILTLTLIFAALSVAYFAGSWDYGYRYQGVIHTQVVALENAVGIAITVTLALVGVRRKSKQMQLSAYLTMFVLLSWCAFPYLGELP